LNKALFLVAIWLFAWGQAGAQEKTRIEVPVFEGGAGLDFFFHAARQYEKQRPDIAVDLYGDPRIADKVRVRVLEGSYPEVTNAGLNYWNLIRNGDVLPLDEFLDQPNWEGDSTWRHSFLPGSLDRYSHEGKIYAIPLLYSVYAVWYNKGLFEENGWQVPRTWDEFFVLCDQIKASGLWPLAFQGRYPGYAANVIGNSYYHLAGAERYYAQQDLVTGSYDNPEYIEALRLMQHTALNYFQPGALGMSHTESQLEFFLGHTAMIFCGSWLKSEMQGKIPDGFRLGSFNLPLVRTGKAPEDAVSAGAGYYIVFKDSKNPQDGVEFLRFMTSRTQAGVFAQMRDIPVAVRGAMDGRLTEDMQDLMRMVQNASTSFGTAPGEGYPDMNQYLDDMRFKLLNGQVTPQEAARYLEESGAAVKALAADPDQVTVRHVWKPVLLLGLLILAVVFWGWTTYGKWREKRADSKPVVSSSMKLRWGWVLLFVGPATLFYTVFVIVPSLKSFAWSGYRWDGLSSDMVFVGLLHFKRLLFGSDAFWTALQNNLFIMFVIPCCVLPLALFLAVCISREVYGARMFRIVFFFPNILGSVAATLLWMHLYNPQGGPINTVLVALGFSSFESYAWLAQDNLYWSLVPMSIWGAAGFNMILFLAAMESIPQSVYEAADIDGASPWRQFWTITLPLIWEVLSISVVFMIIGGMKAFEVIWLLTNQAPVTDNHVIGTRMVQTMFQEFKVGEATAIAVLLFLMVFFGTTATLRAMRRETVEM
jgi:ABC-type sugar transport system permease subunit/ABC-type glycerol-3-phosphate transport system substrate-binding protein